MIKGEIVKGKGTIHPIVILKIENADQFIGCIITHASSTKYPDNIGLKPEHFSCNDDNGNYYEVQFDNSYFVNLNLIKKSDWGPFIKCGCLTEIGTDFIESYLKQNKPILWKDYLKK